MRIEHRIDIEAPVSRVWALTLDIASWPRLTPTITRVERLDEGELAVGSKARLEQPGQPRRVWTVTEIEAPKRFAWSTRALGTRMTGTHDLVPTETGTTNVLGIELGGPLAPLLGLLARRALRKAIAAENQGFKTAAEGDAPTG